MMRIRPTVRLLVIDDRQRLLLFHIHDVGPLHEAHPDMTVYWVTPGGGVEPHETFEQAALRELWEETGIRASAIGPCVWRYERVLLLSRGQFRLQERFFVVTIPASQVSMTNMLPHEQETHRAYRWWSAEELAESQEYFLPPPLPRLIQPLLLGHIPEEPLQL